MELGKGTRQMKMMKEREINVERKPSDGQRKKKIDELVKR